MIKKLQKIIRSRMKNSRVPAIKIMQSSKKNEIIEKKA